MSGKNKTAKQQDAQLMKTAYGAIKLKFTLFFVSFVAALFVMIVIVSVQQIQQAVAITVSIAGMPVLERAAGFIDGDKYERLSQTLDPSDTFFIETQAKFRELKKEARCLYLYTMTPYKENVHRFIFDGEDPESENFSPLGKEEDISGYEKCYMQTFSTKKPQFSSMAFLSDWGNIISAYMPILNSKGDIVGVVGIDFEGEGVYKSVYKHIMSNVARQIIYALIFTAIGLFFYFLLLRDLNRQNEKLVEMRQREETASRIITERFERSNKFSDTLAEMTKHPTISTGILKEAADVIAEKGCLALKASSIGIWRLAAGSNALECVTCYDASTGRHSAQKDFSLSDRKEYHSRLISERMIVMNTAEECSRIIGSFDGYEGLCAALDAPVRLDGKLFGAVCVEQYCGGEFDAGREWTVEEYNFVSSLADLTSLAISSSERSKAQTAAEEANRSKSNFLAKTSHEIRTPMNAIIGMAELALRENISGAPREHVLTIKQAGENLLSIINDILDFSKIESGKMEIVPEQYLLSSMLNDVSSIIRMRVVDSQVRFVVNVDSNIPNALFGDEIRIRQVLLNLLNNAVKFTPKGYVSFTVTGEEADGGAVTLTMEVADSGKGIKEEDIGKLFGDFVQIDSANNKGIEGTGLGLAIARNLVKTMGGDIAVASEYGKGSVFTVKIPQAVRDAAKIASVENPEGKSVLVYERREMYANSIICTVDNLGVECTLVSNAGELREELERGGYTFVFIASGLYNGVREICGKFASKAKIVLLAGFGEAVADKNITMLAMPVYSVSVANLLNGVYDGSSYSESGEAVVRFTAPDAKILVVDDINTNLTVAKGLLSPYKMRVDLCRSGMEAIEAARAKRYDLILMDHMMPEMDGIEAVRRIRELDANDKYYADVPIAALTANALSGTKEMFLANGFNDFLSKPIDTVKLNAALAKWLPKEMQVKITDGGGAGAEARDAGADGINIDGVDVKKGLAVTGGSVESYRKILAVFKNDGLQKQNEISASLKAGGLPLYATYVHALKSAAANIGAVELSAMAKELEAAGNRGDIAFIETRNSELMSALETLVRNIGVFLDADKKDGTIAGAAQFRAALAELESAIDSINPRAIKAAVKGLRTFAGASDVGASVEDILQHTLVGEYDEVLSIIKTLLREVG